MVLKLNQKGFSPVFIILIVILLGAGGLLVWRISQVEEPSARESTVPSKTTEEKTETTTKEYLEIPEANIEIPLTEDTQDLVYKISEDSNDNIILLTLADFIKDGLENGYISYKDESTKETYCDALGTIFIFNSVEEVENVNGGGFFGDNPILENGEVNPANQSALNRLGETRYYYVPGPQAVCVNYEGSPNDAKNNEIISKETAARRKVLQAISGKIQELN